MEQKRNKNESSRHWREDWNGQDSSGPEESWDPDAIDRLLHPALNDLYPPAAPAPAPAAPPPSPAPPPAYVPAPSDSGFYYKNGRPIPPTHPDHGPMHLLPRQEDGSFAAYYYCSHEDLAAVEAHGPPIVPPPRRVRRDGFSAERQAAFVEHYRDCGSLTDAARLTGVSRSTVYNLINNAEGAAFRAAIAEAGRGVDTILEATALERCVNGQEEIVYHQGRRVGVRWKYDNRLLMHMLRARQPLKYAPLSEIQGWLRHRGPEQPVDLGPPLARLAAAEAEWGRRLPSEPHPAPARMQAAIAGTPSAPPAPAPKAAAPSIGWSGTGQGRLVPLPIASTPGSAPAAHILCASTSSSSEPAAPVCASISSSLNAAEPLCASTSSSSSTPQQAEPLSDRRPA